MPVFPPLPPPAAGIVQIQEDASQSNRVGELRPPILILENFIEVSDPGTTVNTSANTINKKRKLLALSSGRALYLFAGPKRRSTIGNMLRKSNWAVEEIDILQGGREHDLTRAKVQTALVDKVATQGYDLLLTSPPCDTFSRVKYANSWGPAPTRSFKYRRGFPWLQGAAKRQTQLANMLVDFNFRLILSHLQHKESMLIVEFPEDLGAVLNGTHKGIRPSSIFQWEEFAQILNCPGVVTGGIRQSDFGEDYLKPTRLILRIPGGVLPNFFPGVPEFDNTGKYLGPIPKGVAKEDTG